MTQFSLDNSAMTHSLAVDSDSDQTHRVETDSDWVQIQKWFDSTPTQIGINSEVTLTQNDGEVRAH